MDMLQAKDTVNGIKAPKNQNVLRAKQLWESAKQTENARSDQNEREGRQRRRITNTRN